MATHSSMKDFSTVSFAGRAFLPLVGTMIALACNLTPDRQLGDLGDPLEPPRDVDVPEKVADFAGTWVGYAEDVLGSPSGAPAHAYAFPSGSTQIRLEISSDAPGPPSFRVGTLTFGDGVAPAPASDPSVGYPADPSYRFGDPGGDDGGTLPPFEGFPYNIQLYSMNSTDLRLWLLEHHEESSLSDLNSGESLVDNGLFVSWNTDELYGSWCALLTPDDCDFPAGIGADVEGRECRQLDRDEPIDCLKAALCLAKRCVELQPIEQRSMRMASLRLRMTADGLVGVFERAAFVNERGYRTQLGAVRFERAAP